MGNDKNYGRLSREEVPKIFFEKFVKATKRQLTKYFGEDESNRVIEALSTGRIEIVSMENFWYGTLNVNDRTLDIYNKHYSADDFFYKGIAYFKEQAENGNSHIEVREFFFAFVDMIKKCRLTPEQVKSYVKTLLYSLTNITHESPFHIQLLSPQMRNIVKERYGLCMDKYSEFARAFFVTYNNLPIDFKYAKEFFPKLEVLYPVYPSARWNQEQYLASIYAIDRRHVETLCRSVSSLTTNKEGLCKVLDSLEAETGKILNRESIQIELDRIEKNNPSILYPTNSEFSEFFKSMGVKKATFNAKNINKTCVNLDLFPQTLQPYFSHIIVNCEGLKKEELNYYIDIAKSLSLVKSYYRKDWREMCHNLTETDFRISLVNIEDLSNGLVEFVQNKMKQLKSVTNKNFIVDVSYSNNVVQQKFDKSKEPYIRVISDIHADYNDNRYAYNFGEDFVINCGDTAGDARTCISWCKCHMKHGVIVAGNHFGYGKCFPELDKMDFKNTKGKQINIIAANFRGGNRPIMFLSNTVTEYKDIVILGTTLYTDFALYGDEHIEEAMKYAKDNMNDFRVVTVAGHRNYTKDENGKWNKGWKSREDDWETRLFTPQDHAYYFDYSYQFLQDKVEQYKNKPIIIVTHHAPSPYSISPEYTGSMLNPAFASNLNEFIVSNPQIRLWCHGHCHNHSDYILGKTRVVCDPFGYNNENNVDLPYNYGTRIRVADIKSREPWTDICSEEIKFGLVKVYEK